MAEEMQGIMGLSNAQAPQDMGRIDPSQFSPVVESYAKNNPREFGQDILGGMAQADPALVEEFTRTLMSLSLPTELIDAMQMMIDDILANPEDYAEMRAAYIKEGVPEELLPMEFDAAYFAALNIAMDQLYEGNAEQMAPGVPTFAQGGIINVKDIAKELSGMGRNGDTMLAHITPMEARMLRRRGGSGTINPETGLPEFFLKSLVKSVGKVFKAVGKAVTSVVKKVGEVVKKVAATPLGKIALTAAAVYFMGPLAGKLGITNAALANGVNTFAANTVVNLASGQKIGDALKGGLVSGAIAGAATSVFDTGIFGQKAAPAAPPAIDTLDDLATANVVTPSSVSAQTFPLSEPSSITGTNIGATSGFADDLAAPSIFKTPSLPGSIAYTPPSTAYGGVTPPAPSIMDTIAQKGTSLVNQGSDILSQGKDFLTSAYDKISPSAIQANAGPEALKKVMADYGVSAAQVLEAPAGSVLAQAYKAAMPGIIGTYGPLAAVGLAGATAMGAFTPPEPVMPSNMDQFTTTGEDLLQQRPEDYGLQYGGVNTTYAQNPYANLQATDLSRPGQAQFSTQSNPYEGMYRGFTLPASQTMPGSSFVPRFPTSQELFNPNMTEEERRQMMLAQSGIGGIQQFAKGGEAYPRKTGAINGPGTGTSDSVPAMLSDGEFVFTAKAVRALGQGSRRKGAKRMYALMKQLERKAS